ncbi:MAG TPA: hypothetical protein VKZ65_02945 [Glycomyces sp.]|nr:hypothetical protein [Glycomyces sp.]
MTETRSAYPKPVDELVPAARALADELGALPSRNQLKARLRIGAPKANAVLAELADYTPTARPAETGPALGSAEASETAETDPAAPATGSAPAGPDEVDTGEATPMFDTVPTEAKPQDATLVDPAVPAAAEKADAVTATGPEADKVKPRRRLATWPVLLLMLPATVAIWSGWVGLGQLAGFGPVHPLPGIADGFVIDTSITLPIGMETYSAYALYVWLSGRAGVRAIAFARTSALLALVIGAAGQIAYHLMSAANVPAAHPLITAAVACIPVAVLGLGAALAHLVKEDA